MACSKYPLASQVKVDCIILNILCSRTQFIILVLYSISLTKNFNFRISHVLRLILIRVERYKDKCYINQIGLEYCLHYNLHEAKVKKNNNLEH